MKRLKVVWYVIVVILCFLLIFGAIVFCLKEWGGAEKYQGGVLVWSEQKQSAKIDVFDESNIGEGRNGYYE